MEIVLAQFVGRFEEGFGFYWDLPPGVLGSVDLSNPASWAGVKADVGARTGQLLCAVEDGTIDDSFVRLSNENAVDARPDARILDAWFSITGFRPAGDTIADLLFDHLTRGADPAGLSACFPLIPQTDLQMPVWLAGQKVRDDRFQLGQHAHSAKLVAYLKRNLRATRIDALASRIRNRKGIVDRDAHRRAIDWWCEKLADRNPALEAAVFNAIRPADWPTNETPLAHETVLTDNFNTGTGALGANWTQVTGATSVDTNQARITTNPGVNRYEADLSGDDQYSQNIVTTRSGNHLVTVQWNAGNLQRYAYIQNSSQARLTRVTAAGSGTVFATATQAWAAVPFTIRIEKNGNSIKGIQNGTTVVGPTTDTNITGNRRCGWEGSAAAGQWIDDWEAGDLSSGSTFNESVGLAGVAGLSTSPALSLSTSITLAASSTISESPANVISSATQLAATANLQATARLIASSALSLAANASFLATLTVAGGPQTFNESVGLSAIAGLSVAARNQLAAAILLAAQASMAMSAKRVASEMVAMGATADVVAQAQALYSEAIAIAVRAAFEAEGRTGSIYAAIAEIVWRLDAQSPVFRLDGNAPVWRVDQ